MNSIRNEADRAKIIERMRKLNGDEVPLWGKMTVGQMMSHLVQAGELPFVESVPDRSNFMSRTFLKPLVLYVLPMPKEVTTSSEMNQQENGRCPQEFEADKREAIEGINKVGTLPVGQECLSHPFFGKMSAKEWAVIAHKHTDHHLKQFGV